MIVLQYMQTQCDENGKFSTSFVKDFKIYLESIPHLKSNTKVLMQFGAFMRDESIERGLDALAIVLPFNQKQILSDNSIYIKETLDLKEITFYDVEDLAKGIKIPGETKKMSLSVPGKPSFQFYTGEISNS